MQIEITAKSLIMAGLLIGAGYFLAPSTSIDDTWEGVQNHSKNYSNTSEGNGSIDLQSHFTDSDQDGLSNHREEKLPNASPWRKDLYIYLLTAPNSPGLSNATIKQTRQQFAAMPVSNPNGQNGIRLHVIGREEAPNSITWSKGTFDSIRDSHYDEERLGDWHCSGHLVIVAPTDEQDVAGRGNAPGHTVMMTAENNFRYDNGDIANSLTLTHELLHNIVGEYPASYTNVSTRTHSKTGYLSHSDSAGAASHLSDPTRTVLSNRGFADLPDNTVSAC